MAIQNIDTKCWILALFVRSDGERFLLGDGNFEFIEKQLHFVANTMANDVVEVQGNDGFMLAGQVRRPSAQSFDGYIGDSSTSKVQVEENRQKFLAFFRKNYFYKVIYVFPDGSAIQRKRGFLVDAPEAKELYQIYPQYHVALNFEDVNYYYYDEDSEGQEIYGKSATIPLNSVRQSGGLIWMDWETVTQNFEGTEFTARGTASGGVLSNLQLKGNTFQQTYSGKNLLQITNTTTTSSGVTYTVNSDGTVTTSGIASALTVFNLIGNNSFTLPAGTYTLSGAPAGGSDSKWRIDVNNGTDANMRDYGSSGTFTLTQTTTISNVRIRIANGTDTNGLTFKPMIEIGSSPTAFEPFVGGIASPNPDYPQEVQTVTGRQVVTITDGGSESQEYEVNLGKNLCDLQTATASGEGISISSTNDAIEYQITTVSGTGRGIIVDADIKKGKTYTLKAVRSAGVNLDNIRISNGDWNTSGAYQGVSVTNTFGDGATFIANADYSKIRFWVYNANYGGVNSGTLSEIQLELGSTATSYATYFTPIELCEIGDYQDRIYRSGSDWYIHKEVNKAIFDGTENWSSAPDGVNSWVLTGKISVPYNTSKVQILSTIFRGISRDDRGTAGNNIIYSTANDTFWIRNTSLATLANVQGATNGTPLYYALATPTNTQITNTALITQLNALAGATTYNGFTSFTVDGNGNLAAVLSVDIETSTGGGVMWDDDGAVWEEGRPSYTNITVDSIDNVYPVLTITGNTQNPVLTDVSSGSVFQYSGTITESQVLVVDMMNKTAFLNGVSVIGNITGDWLYLKPGNNRITYTADNADAPSAKIEWQEIVG